MKHIKLTSLIKEVIHEAFQPMDIGQSVWSLVKSNNGKFKSDKQAAFLKSQLEKTDGVIKGGEIYGHGFNFFVDWDDEGITKITQNNQKTGNKEVKWERKMEGTLRPQDEKMLKKLNKTLKTDEEELNRLKTDLEKFESGEYRPSPNFDETLKRLIATKTARVASTKDAINKLINS
jgi:hypothetical protein